MSSQIKIDDLPDEIIAKICEKLANKDLGNLSQVNRKLNLIADDEFLWKQKLLNDIHKWKYMDSNTYPKHLFTNEQELLISYKKAYLNCCPEISTKKEILKKLETFQQVQSALHLTSTSDSLTESYSNNLTLSSFSSLAMPMQVLGQIKDFIYRNVFNTNESDFLPKLVMFGPGLETTTSCLVTNILWKSKFKTIGMIPGKDGYGSGIKLKLFNHKPFNLTILYTNMKKVRNENKHDPNLNRLLMGVQDKETNEIQYELHPQVKEACADASGFVYVIDNKDLANGKADQMENYKLELSVLMREARKDLPLLILACNVNNLRNENDKLENCLSCAEIVQMLKLFDLEREWHIRNCEIFQENMKDVILGFEWILDNLDEKYFIKKIKKSNQELE